MGGSLEPPRHRRRRGPRARVGAGATAGCAPATSSALAAATFAVTGLAFAMLGAGGLALFSRVWSEYAVAFGVGIGLVARLFYDVAEQHRLAAAQGRFRAVLDEATDAIRIIDCDNQRMRVGRQPCRLRAVGLPSRGAGGTQPA